MNEDDGPSNDKAKDTFKSKEAILSGNKENDEISPSLLQTENEAADSSPRKQPLMLKRHPYSKAEQQQIVDYIINAKGYKFIKGVQLWKEMQNDNAVCRGRRTWQSMKEHFLKQIVPQLHIYKNVNEKVANCFKRSLMGLPFDLEDSDSSEDEQKQSKKKSLSPRDKHDKGTDPSGSDSDVNSPYQSLKKRRMLDANQKKDRIDISKSNRNQRLKKFKTCGREGRSVIEGDTTEEEDSTDYQHNRNKHSKQKYDEKYRSPSSRKTHISESGMCSEIF